MRQPRVGHVLGQSLLGARNLRGKLPDLMQQIAEMEPAAPCRLDIHLRPGKSSVDVDLRAEQSIYGPVKSILGQVDPQRPGVKVRARSKRVYDRPT